jgi:small subunit ribosomal protein S18
MSDETLVESAPEAILGDPAAAEAGLAAAQRRAAKRGPRRKLCYFCGQYIDNIDYKDTKTLRRFITDRGKIIPRRMTGTCAFHQRQLTAAIKRARVIALLPFTAE